MPRLLLLVPIILFAPGCSTASNEASQETSAALVLNGPALFGQNIDQMTSSLGQPEWDSVSVDAAESTRHFRRDMFLLRVGYGARTRKVRSFLVQTAHGQTGDYQYLLRLVNLTGSEPALVVVPLLSATNSGSCNGVKVFMKDGGGF